MCKALIVLLLQDDRKVDKYVISKLEAQQLQEKDIRLEVEEQLAAEKHAMSTRMV